MVGPSSSHGRREKKRRSIAAMPRSPPSMLLWVVGTLLVTIRATTSAWTTTPQEEEEENVLRSRHRRLSRGGVEKFSSCEVIDEDLLEDLMEGETEFLRDLTGSNRLVGLQVVEFNANNILNGRTGSLRVETLDSNNGEFTLNGITAVFDDVSNLIPTLNLREEPSAVRQYLQQVASNFQAIAVQGEVQRGGGGGGGDGEEYRALIVGPSNGVRLLVHVDSQETDSVLTLDFDEADGRWGQRRSSRRESKKERDDKQKSKFKGVKDQRREDLKKGPPPNNNNNNNNNDSDDGGNDNGNFFSGGNNDGNDNNDNNNNNNNNDNNNNNNNNENVNVVSGGGSSSNNNNNNENQGPPPRNQEPPPNQNGRPPRRLQNNKNNNNFSFDDDESLDLSSVDCDNLDQTCVDRIESEFLEEMQAIADDTRQRYEELEQRVAHLDRRRFEQVAVAGVSCFALYRNDLTARAVFDCLQEFLPSLQERYALRYRPILNNRYEIELSRLRTVDLLVNRKQTEAFYTCCPANRDDEDDAERRVLAAPARALQLPQSRAVPTAKQVLVMAETLPQQLDVQRGLQDDDICLVDDFDDDREGELLDISDSLYDSWVAAQGGRRRSRRRLGQSHNQRKLQIQFEGSTAPSDAFSIRDFDMNVQHSQQVTHKTEGYALDVTQVAEVVVDLEAIVDDKGNLPKKVRKYINKYDMDATAVDAVIPSTSGDIPFVGIIMTSDDTSKQLLWPADFDNYSNNVPQEELTRARRTLRSIFGQESIRQQEAARAASQQRRLQDSAESFAESAANGLCSVNDNAAHAQCRDEARAAFAQEADTLVEEETAILLELDKEETALYHELLEAHISAAFDCGAAEDGEIAELAVTSPDEYDEPASFDPDATFDCVRFTRSSFVVNNHVTQLSEMQNRRRFVQERTKSLVQDANLKWVGRLKRCCLEETLWGAADPNVDTDNVVLSDGGLTEKRRNKLEKQRDKLERQLQKAENAGKKKRIKKLRKRLDKVEKELEEGSNP